MLTIDKLLKEYFDSNLRTCKGFGEYVYEKYEVGDWWKLAEMDTTTAVVNLNQFLNDRKGKLRRRV